MELNSFTALDEQVTKEDWEQTPASVRRLLQWLFESYEKRLSELEEEKAFSKVESATSVEGSTNVPPSPPVEPKKASCSFCEKKQKEVVKLIAGPNVCICNDCVEICNAILEDDRQ